MVHMPEGLLVGVGMGRDVEGNLNVSAGLYGVGMLITVILIVLVDYIFTVITFHG